MMGGSAPDMGTAIYRIDNVPATVTDTQIKLADTDKDFTILTEMSFPNAYIPEGKSTWQAGVQATAYGVGSLAMSATTSMAMLLFYSNFARIRFFEKQAYRYAGDDRYPFYSNDKRHRFAHWHASGSNTASVDLDGYDTLTTPEGTYAASDDTLLVQGNENCTFHTMLVYDKVLTEQEIDAYIQDGIIP